MLSAISVKKPLIVVVMLIIVIALGVVSYLNTNVDLLPEMELPYMVIVTVYAGQSPDTVEKEVTDPIEASIAKVSGVDKIFSTSAEHYSMITLQLDYSASVDKVKQDIQSQLELTALPSDEFFNQPIIIEVDPSLLSTMTVSISSEGQTNEEAASYLSKVTEAIASVSGVARVNANGLVSDMVYMNVNFRKITQSFIDKLLAEYDMTLTLSAERKESIRQELISIINEAENDPSLSTDGEIDPAKVLDRLLERLSEQIETGEGSGAENAILDLVITELSRKDSNFRAEAIESIDLLLDNRFILEDGEENREIFDGIVDEAYAGTVVNFFSAYLKDTLSAINADVLTQVIYAQDLDVPAGSVTKGATSIIVQLGDNIADREDFMKTPAVSVNVGELAEQYVNRIKAVLTILALASEDGVYTLTDTDLHNLSEMLSWANEEVDDYAQWVIDETVSQYGYMPNFMSENGKTAWKQIIESDPEYLSYIEAWGTERPLEWRTLLLGLVKNNALYPADEAVIADVVVWDESYSTFYYERATERRDGFADGRPDKNDYLDENSVLDETSYAAALKNYAVNYVMEEAAKYAGFGFPQSYPLSESVLTAWRTLLSNDENFASALARIASDENLHLGKVILNVVAREEIFPVTETEWTAAYTAYYKKCFESSVALLNANRPADAKAYAEWAVDELANNVYGTEGYLSESFISAWKEKMASDEGFNSEVNALSEEDNWQRKILSYIVARQDAQQADPAAKGLFPEGETVTPVRLWGNYKNYFTEALETRLNIYSDYESRMDSIRQEIGEEAFDLYMDFFRGRTPEQNYNLLVNLIRTLEEYGGEGAVVITENPDTGIKTYAIDFNVLEKTLEENTEEVYVSMELESIADVLFLNDATKQIATLIQNNGNGFTEGASVVLSIEKDPDSPSTEVVDKVMAKLKSEKESNPSFSYSVIASDGDTIDFMMDSVLENLLYGALLAAAVLFIFLLRIKPTLTVSMSIVFSVVVTFVLMYFAGITLNLISMCGLVLGVGMLVDNSIIVLENIQRLRLQGKSNFAASVQGAKQMGGAIIASTLTTVVVFLPMVFVEGLVKKIFTDMALTVCFSLLASLLVALTLIPSATTYFVTKPPAKENKVFKTIKRGYAKALNFSLNNKWIAIILTVVLLAGSAFAVFSTAKTEIFPSTYLGLITVNFEISEEAIDERNAGLSVMDDAYFTYDDALAEIKDQVTDVFKQYPDIASAAVYLSAGMNIGGMNIGGGALTASVNLVDSDKRTIDPQILCDELESELNIKGGKLYSATVAMSSIISYATMDSGYYLNVNLFGNDYSEMNARSQELGKLLEKLDGVTYVNSDVETADEVYKLSVDKATASKYGLTVGQIYLQLSQKLSSVSSSHTLRIYNENDSSERTSSDVYIYSSDYVNTSWYNAISPDGKEVKLYFLNNINDGEGKADYYVYNESGSTLFVKNPDGKAEAVYDGGKIYLRKENGFFVYDCAVITPEEDGTHTVIYEKKTYKVDDFAKFYSVKKEEIDLVNLEIQSEDLLGTGAATVNIPLYKLLNDDSFVKDENGNVIYRTTETGEKIPASIASAPGYTSVKHADGRKQIALSVGYDPDSVSAKELESSVQKVLDEFFGEDNSVTAEIAQGNEMMEEVFNNLYLILGFGIALIYLIMVAQFQSWKKPFIVMFAIPLAFTGSFLAILITGIELSAVALMGIIVLMGVAVNNGIVFVEYTGQLIDSGADKRTALIRTGIDRLRPILMTTLTTVCAMFIMAFDNSDYGKLLAPLAITMLGGLIYATLITLFLVPIMFDIFNRKAKVSNAVKMMREANVTNVDASDVFELTDEKDVAFIEKVVGEDRTGILTIAARKISALCKENKEKRKEKQDKKPKNYRKTRKTVTPKEEPTVREDGSEIGKDVSVEATEERTVNVSEEVEIKESASFGEDTEKQKDTDV